MVTLFIIHLTATVLFNLTEKRNCMTKRNKSLKSEFVGFTGAEYHVAHYLFKMKLKDNFTTAGVKHYIAHELKLQVGSVEGAIQSLTKKGVFLNLGNVGPNKLEVTRQLNGDSELFQHFVAKEKENLSSTLEEVFVGFVYRLKGDDTTYKTEQDAKRAWVKKNVRRHREQVPNANGDWMDSEEFSYSVNGKIHSVEGLAALFDEARQVGEQKLITVWK